MSVAINALINLAAHASKGNVRWQTGLPRCCSPSWGRWPLSDGKITDGHYITLPFSLLMLVVAGLTLKRNPLAGNPLPSSILPFIPPSYGPAFSRWAGWRAFWALAADFWLCRRWSFFASRWLRRWQPHWWSAADGAIDQRQLRHVRKVSLAITCWLIVGGVLGGVVGWHSPSA
ncbi:sulfite exporter TauE/SafE family protein [Serratia ureilytica]